MCRLWSVFQCRAALAHSHRMKRLHGAKGEISPDDGLPNRQELDIGIGPIQFRELHIAAPLSCMLPGAWVNPFGCPRISGINFICIQEMRVINISAVANVGLCLNARSSWTVWVIIGDNGGINL